MKFCRKRFVDDEKNLTADKAQRALNTAVDTCIMDLSFELITYFRTIRTGIIAKKSGSKTPYNYGVSNVDKRTRKPQKKNLEKLNNLRGTIDTEIPLIQDAQLSALFSHIFFKYLKMPTASYEEMEGFMVPFPLTYKRHLFTTNRYNRIVRSRAFYESMANVYIINSLDALAYYLYLLRKDPNCYDAITGKTIKEIIALTFLRIFHAPQLREIAVNLFQLLSLYSFPPEALNHQFIYKTITDQNQTQHYKRFINPATTRSMMMLSPNTLENQFSINDKLVYYAKRSNVLFPGNVFTPFFLFWADFYGKEFILEQFEEHLHVDPTHFSKEPITYKNFIAPSPDLPLVDKIYSSSNSIIFYPSI